MPARAGIDRKARNWRPGSGGFRKDVGNRGRDREPIRNAVVHLQESAPGHAVPGGNEKPVAESMAGVVDYLEGQSDLEYAFGGSEGLCRQWRNRKSLQRDDRE